VANPNAEGLIGLGAILKNLEILYCDMYESGFQYPLNQYGRQSNLLTLLRGGGSLVRYL